jgi:nicotinamide mononucleotide (NMN) deamidase PncC
MLLAAALGLSACAGSQGQTANDPGNGTGKVCTQEANTGTNISHTVCRTQQQTEDERKAAQDLAAPRAKPSNNR